MSNKRVKTEQGWYEPIVQPVPGAPVLPPRPSTGSVAADVALGVLDTWYYQESQAWQELALKRQRDLANSHERCVNLSRQVDTLNRGLTRRNTLLNIANEQIGGLRREVDFKTALIAEIFARFPEVGHEYEWAFNDEVLGEHFEDPDATETEVEEVED